MPEISKVVHVLRRFVPAAWGGTESVACEVSRELSRQGIECTLHCTAMLAAPGCDTMGPLTVHRHRYVFPWLGLSALDRQAMERKGGSPLSLSLFLGLLREKNVSIIHTHVQHRLGGMARTAARLRGIPYVVSLHGGHFTLPQDQIDSMRAPFAGKAEWGKLFGALFGSRRVLEDADGIICVGRSEYDQVRKEYPTKPVYHVPNGVDVQRFRQADGRLFRQSHGFDEKARIVLCVSRIDPQKNQAGLVRAFARFAVSHPDHRLVLVGPVAVPAYFEALVDEVRQLGLQDKVRIVAGMRPDDPMLPSAYKAAEQLVLPSVYEPFGIVVLEAWSAGLPVLASRVGGVPDFAEHRKTALLVEPGSEQELCAGMEELADRPMFRSELAERAWHVVEEGYDWSVAAGRILGIYRELVENH